MKTADLEVITQHPERFIWGNLTTIHAIGPYHVVEFKHPDEVTGEIGTEYMPYVEGRTTSISVHSLDAALVLAIGCRHLPDPSVAHDRVHVVCDLLGVQS